MLFVEQTNIEEGMEFIIFYLLGPICDEDNQILGIKASLQYSLIEKLQPIINTVLHSIGLTLAVYG